MTLMTIKCTAFYKNKHGSVACRNLEVHSIAEMLLFVERWQKRGVTRIVITMDQGHL